MILFFFRFKASAPRILFNLQHHWNTEMLGRFFASLPIFQIFLLPYKYNQMFCGVRGEYLHWSVNGSTSSYACNLVSPWTWNRTHKNSKHVRCVWSCFARGHFFFFPGSHGVGQGVGVGVTDLVVFLPDQVFSVVLFAFQLAQSLVVFFADGL